MTEDAAGQQASVISELFSGEDGRAAAVVGQVREADLPALLAALLRPDRDVRWWAVCALGHLPGAEATAALARLAADEDADVRAAVLHGLGQRAAVEAVTPLLFALDDPSEYLARLATDALARIGAPAVPGLIQALRQDAQARVRGNAARALAAIADPASIPALMAALEDESALVRHWADAGLERLGVGMVYFEP
jgi:HEAT repeat protein